MTSPLYLKALARGAFRWQAAGPGDGTACCLPPSRRSNPRRLVGATLTVPHGGAATGSGAGPTVPSHKVRTEEVSTPRPLQKRAGLCHPILLPRGVPVSRPPGVGASSGSSESSRFHRTRVWWTGGGWPSPGRPGDSSFMGKPDEDRQAAVGTLARHERMALSERPPSWMEDGDTICGTVTAASRRQPGAWEAGPLCRPLLHAVLGTAPFVSGGENLLEGRGRGIHLWEARLNRPPILCFPFGPSFAGL